MLRHRHRSMRKAGDLPLISKIDDRQSLCPSLFWKKTTAGRALGGTVLTPAQRSLPIITRKGHIGSAFIEAGRGCSRAAHGSPAVPSWHAYADRWTVFMHFRGAPRMDHRGGRQTLL